jgi:hypothetical protein
MRDLFDRIKAEGEPAINRLREEQRQESVALEFKRKHDSTNGEAAREDKENLGSILSAFSNSMGGLLIWGVEARKTGDGIDCAIELQPISAIARFESDVGRRAAEALMPRHEGIEIASVRCADGSDRGYLLVLVERSERRPHRCEFKGVKQYYKRIGDNTFAMEHYDIEDAFKRMTVPELELRWKVRQGRSGPCSYGGVLISIVTDIFIQNTSTVSGHSPYLIVDQVSGANREQNFQYKAGPGLALRQSNELYLFGGINDAIRPELPQNVLSIVLNGVQAYPKPPPPYRTRSGDTWALPDLIRLPDSIRLSYKCGCFNSRQETGTIEISRAKLEPCLDGYVFR